MSARIRLLRVLSRPGVLTLLLVLLIADALALFPPRGPHDPPMWGFKVYRTGTGLSVVFTGDAVSGTPVASGTLVRLHGGEGAWAVTTRAVWFRILLDPSLSPSDTKAVEDALAGRFAVDPAIASSTMAQEFVRASRSGTLRISEPVWIGYAHDAVSACLALMLAGGAFGLVHRKFRSVRMATRAGRGCCVACGYDLKGSAGGVCPECGKGASV